MQEINLTGVLSIGGDPAVIESKTITENGTYTAPSGVDGYSPVTVNVPKVIEPKTITENGTYTAPSGVDGYSPVTVNVPIVVPVIEPKTIIENGTYTAPSGVNGFSPVVVNVPNDNIITSFALKNNVLNEGGATITYNYDSLSIVWGGASNIGCCINFQVPFTNKNKIIVDISLYGENYQHTTNNSTRNFNTAIGVTDNVQSSYIDLTSLDNNNHLLADVEFNGIDNYGLTNIHREVDISNIIDTPMYLFFQIPGVTLTNLKVKII